MLKRISVDQLAVGMYVKEFCGSWMDHPFWRTSFVITDPQDIASIHASNINAAARYLKIYNKASAPTVGTDVPVLTVPLPAGQVVQIDGGSTGIRFGTGIAWALTVTAADSATDAVAASEIKVAISYT